MSLTPNTWKTQGDQTLQKTNSFDILLTGILDDKRSLEALHLGNAFLLKSCHWIGHI